MNFLENNVKQWNMTYTEYKLDVAQCEVYAVQSCLQPKLAKDGSQIDMRTCEEGIVYMQSQYKPKEEAKRFAARYESMKRGACVLFLGVGNGYVVRELTKYRDVKFVFYEPDIVAFAYAMQHYDFSDIIKADNIKIFVEGCNANVLPMSMYGFVHGLNWHLFFLDAVPKYRKLYPEADSWLTKLYEDSKVHGYQNYDIDSFYADVHMRRAISNLPYLYNANSLYDYKGILEENRPVIMVAAGPSLEKNAALLKQYRDKAFIIAVDHATTYLLAHGILPHAFVTVDAKKPVSLFETAADYDIPWLFYTTANTDGLCCLKKSQKIVISSLFYYAHHLYRKIGSDLHDMVSGGSVATIAVGIAMFLGSKQIILVGQDLAYTGDKEYAGIDGNTPNIVLQKVKGQNGELLNTSESFKAFIEFYTALSAKYADVTFINATEGGAYIDGFLHMTLAEAMQLYQDVPAFDGDARLSSVPTRMTQENQKVFRAEFEKLYSYFLEVSEKVGAAIRCAEEGIEILQKSGYQNIKLNQIEAQMNRFQKVYDGHPGNSIINLGISKAIQDALMDIQFTKDDPTEELTRLYQKMHEFYLSIQKNVAIVIPLMQEVLSVLPDE